MEHCDQIAFELVGATDPLTFKRSRCAAGHKALWHASWDGLPDKEFLALLDPGLAALKDRLYHQTYTSDEVAGQLSQAWADKLGLTTQTVVTVGTIDAHAGAVGGEISPKTLVKVMGTSTCDIMISPYEEIGSTLVKGICGQVDGSVVPGMVGLEAGQSAFGDLLAWFRDIILEPVQSLLAASKSLDAQTKSILNSELHDGILPHLSGQAATIPASQTTAIALDWINGRRTPDTNPTLKGAILGINPGTDAARVFKALVDALCFGSRKIVERLKEEGIAIDAVIAMGGVAKKSPLVMQTMADVLNMPIKVSASEQAPALGSAMYAAVAARVYPDLTAAITAMGGGFDAVYKPVASQVKLYEKLYQQYNHFGKLIEEQQNQLQH